MCDRAAWIIARKAIEAALSESDLVEAINAEVRVHRGVVQEARAILLERGDRPALEVLDGVTGREPEPKRQLPMLDELYGSDPDFTGGVETVEYLRALRGGALVEER